MNDTQKIVVVALAAVGAHTVYKRANAALYRTKFCRSRNITKN